MSIIRAERKSQFYVLPTATIEDDRLSWEARGLLVYLLSKPDHWEVQVGDLMKRTRNCLGKRSGRDKVYAILRELQMAGYIYRRFDRQGGTFQSVTYEVSENADLDAGAAFIASLEKDASPLPAKPETVAPVTDSADTAAPVTANPDALVNKQKAVSTEKAVKNLTADPDEAGESTELALLSEQEQKALAQGPGNYPQSPNSKTFATWLAYAIAFKAIHHQWPIYNATVGAQVAKLVKRLGPDAAPMTARYYVEAVKTPAIADNCHPISSLLSNCESYAVKAQEFEKIRQRRTVIEKAHKAAASTAPTAPPVPAEPLAAKKEINSTAQQARQQLGDMVGGNMKRRLTA